MIVHGIVHARREWPLLGLAVSHALLHHVDRVQVILHDPDRDSDAGLRVLGERWGERLSILRRTDDANFSQAAATNIAIERAAPSWSDWVYVFDADEFLITTEAGGLRAVLAGIPSGVGSVRYQVMNRPSFLDFDDSCPEAFLRLDRRAVPSQFVPLPLDLVMDEIHAGNLSFFDIPFPSKVVMRGSPELWLSAGAHSVAGMGDAREVDLAPDAMHAAHVPLLSRKRLQQRAATGREHIRAGFPRSHGWQSRLAAEFADRDELERLWRSHAIDDESGAEPCATQVDLRFCDAVADTLAREGDVVRRAWRAVPDEVSPAAGDRLETLIPVSDVIRAVRRREALADRERAEAAAREAASHRERAALHDELEQRAREREHLRKALAERDDLVASLIAERDALDRTVAAMSGSRVWRQAEWLRELVRR